MLVQDWFSSSDDLTFKSWSYLHRIHALPFPPSCSSRRWLSNCLSEPTLLKGEQSSSSQPSRPGKPWREQGTKRSSSWCRQRHWGARHHGCRSSRWSRCTGPPPRLETRSCSVELPRWGSRHSAAAPSCWSCPCPGGWFGPPRRLPCQRIGAFAYQLRRNIPQSWSLGCAPAFASPESWTRQWYRWQPCSAGRCRSYQDACWWHRPGSSAAIRPTASGLRCWWQGSRNVLRCRGRTWCRGSCSLSSRSRQSLPTTTRLSGACSTALTASRQSPWWSRRTACIGVSRPAQPRSRLRERWERDWWQPFWRWGICRPRIKESWSATNSMTARGKSLAFKCVGRYGCVSSPLPNSETVRV